MKRIRNYSFHLEAFKKKKKIHEKKKKLELLIEGDTIRKSLSDSKSMKAIAEMF